MVQAEYEAIKDHLDSYMTNTSTAAMPKQGKSKQPSRNISHLTQMAAKALGREVPGKMGRHKRPEGLERVKEKVAWDELADYQAKRKWKEPLDHEVVETGERAQLELNRGKSWAGDGHGQAK